MLLVKMNQNFCIGLRLDLMNIVKELLWPLSTIVCLAVLGNPNRAVFVGSGHVTSWVESDKA